MLYGYTCNGKTILLLPLLGKPFSYCHCYIQQKQPPEVFCKKRCSKKFRKIHRKTPVSGSLFNKVEGLRPATLLKKTLLQVFSS